MNHLTAINGQTPYWNPGETPLVKPQFAVGTMTHLGKITKVMRGAYTLDAQNHTIMYVCEKGRIAEYDLLNIQRPTGGDHWLGHVVRWFEDGKFKTFVIETLGFNPYEFWFEGDAMVSPVGAYLVGDGSAMWVTI